ncbi:type I restriction enzyme HsdR N-terminal domain-containing protein [Sporolactobacillus laevolacticus]|uniref:Type I restriction enzyme R protein N-terminal domain-containing protein n=1 Tax=Sporolactobacillus laevolacticus DSM 442 TaxID=1395513 RepID=V6ITU6_9BACL|nr:type I restriction enzyme HsdR N-terminal domain-containing protein [Sporolactobacillus laevolacticus]EST10235.1 hypothetical protein P343_18325 [Sporolactobacillus laevolacticus DSM 442]
MGNETLELDLDYIQKKYEKNKFSNEENIKNKVVRHFLEMLDYDEDSFDYEHKTLHRKGRADIVITVGNNDNNCLYIETKKANEPLDAEAKDQLATYIFNRGKEWGILTNGRKYLLFNSNIKGHNNLERIVFEVDIFNKKDKRFIKASCKIKLAS